MTFEQLLARADALAATGGRATLGIVGSPAAGKTTLARAVARELADRSVVVGMDGFHLAQAELRRLDRADRKGAPDTFDAYGYVHLLRRLKDAKETVYAPEFRREIEEPIAGAVPVPPEIPLVITEGNYLLLDSEPWRDVRGLLDEVWFLAPDEHERIERLVTRHRRYGRSLVEARRRALGSDQRNADLIAATARHADLVVDRLPLVNFQI
jgi:pantothenate kinase